MPRVAFFTFGIMCEPRGHPHVQGFLDRAGSTLQAAREWDGMIGVLGTYVAQDPDRDDPLKRPYLYPRAVPDAAPGPPQARTLSLWRDLESVYSYAYQGNHGEALRQAKEWFVESPWPSYVAWWVADDAEPTWGEAVERLDHLHKHGPTPQAFTFRVPFDSSGNPTALRRPVLSRPWACWALR
jgi:hypothetical protein